MGVVIRMWAWLKCVWLVGLVVRRYVFCSCLFLCNVAKIAQKTFEIVQKLRPYRYGDTIILTNMLTTCPDTSMCECEVLSDAVRKLRADFVYDNGVVAIHVSLLHVCTGETSTYTRSSYQEAVSTLPCTLEN